MELKDYMPAITFIGGVIATYSGIYFSFTRPMRGMFEEQFKELKEQFKEVKQSVKELTQEVKTHGERIAKLEERMNPLIHR